MTAPRVCVIGAGSSGITSVKALADAGMPFDCFEKGSAVGGNWVFQNDNGMSACYRTLHINTSKPRMEYADYPMPDDYPDFPDHRLMAAYFDRYVDVFGLREKIAFGTAVTWCTRRPDGVWDVTLDNGETRAYDMLIVANGHHWDARWPEPAFTGRFDGVQVHSHSYEDHAPYAGKRVVVLGVGNSAMDIAVELSRTAAKTYLSARRGAWILPKYWFGRPLDQLPQHPLLPFALRRRLVQLAYDIAVGDPTKFGLPKPDHRLAEAHPTISGEILTRIGSGDIAVKPNIAELRGDRVAFTDGSVEDVDAIIYCTGYKISFPFFDSDLISAPDNEIALYRNVFHPDLPNVAFVGLCQPLGAVMPIAEQQSKWIIDYLTGTYALPSADRMKRHIDETRARMARRYVGSKRHTIQVDFDDYLYWLAWERRKGRLRAMASGRKPPLAARAPTAVSAAAE